MSLTAGPFTTADSGSQSAPDRYRIASVPESHFFRIDARMSAGVVHRSVTTASQSTLTRRRIECAARSSAYSSIVIVRSAEFMPVRFSTNPTAAT